MNPYDAYITTAKMSMSEREVEASALTKAALLLQACQDHWEMPDREQKLLEALEFNQKLWSIFQASLIQPDHPMSAPLRQDILNLSGFIDKRIFELIAFPDRAKLTAIIQINQNLAAGLRTGEPQPEARNVSAYDAAVEHQEATIWG
jgi:flagellar protein FlaF